MPHVVLDSELTIGTPESVTIYCGIDALSHGLEGCLADIKSSEDDLQKSRECVKLVFEKLPKLISNSAHIEARQNMCLAAYYGGNAINKQLAGYVHGFAHAIGALYHLPHGKAIALSLIAVVSFHQSICQNQLAELAVYCGFAKVSDEKAIAANQFLLALEKLPTDCGFEKGCDVLNENDYKKLTKMINVDSINYSPPKTLRDGEIVCLLDEIRLGKLINES